MNECDDEEDRRSVTSNGTSHMPLSAGPVFHIGEDGGPPNSNQPFGYSQSPFAASQLFRHVSHGDTLGAIRENGYRRTSGNSALDDRSDGEVSPPGTPLYERGRSDSLLQARTKHPLLHVRPRNTSRAPGESAPFRRTINEEDTGTDDHGTPKSHELEIDHTEEHRSGSSVTKANGADPLLAPDEAVTRSAVRSPRMDPSHTEAERTMQPLIAFPTSNLSNSPTDEKSLDLPAHLLSPQTTRTEFPLAKPPGALRSRLSSRVSTSGLSGVLLSDNLGSNDMWNSNNETAGGGNDVLPPASLAYFRLMLRQTLKRENISKIDDWENVLTRLLLQTASTIKSSVNAGDSMDVRTYVKIKKIPGGKITQSEYVDGTVITKNLEHKQMPRHMLNPRIMLLTFPIDYHRVESQLVSLEPLLAQERNYLQHLTRRITDLRPHIVLVERNVSRLALDFLMNAKVSVARGVKPSALQQVARCTQADIIGSMDRLAMEPRLGRCVEFKVQTFEHRLIPGFRKTFMRFEGCHAAFGCTLILRGGDVQQLQVIKRITDFMVLVMNNLSMEVCLFYDDFNIMPPASMMERRNQASKFIRHPSLAGTSAFGSLGRASTTSTRKDRAEEQEQADRQSDEIEKSLRPYLETALSSSAAIAYPPPAPIARMSQLDLRLRQLRLARDEAEAEQILLEEGLGATTPRGNDGKHGQELSLESQESFHSNDTVKASNLTDEPALSHKATVMLAIEEIRLESDIAQTEFEHNEQLKLWSWYVSRHPPDLRPELYQGINYLSSLVCEGSDKPCVGPQMLTRNFYMQDDRTIGQYLETLCTEVTQACPNKQCSRLQLHHFQVLVHGSTRLQIAIDQFPCPSPGNENKIITWSYCKLCKEASPTALIKEETWNMSWSKYLEHAFYPPTTRGGFACPHDAYRDQIRYFALRNLAIRIHNEEIDIYEVQRPSLTLQVRQESRVLIKNQEYTTISTKSASFFDSVSLRLRTFDCQLVKPEKVEDLRQDLAKMSERAMSDRHSMQDSLDRTYKLSSATDVLALNSVYLALQERVVQWDTDFQDLDKKYLPSEKDIRHMTAAHLKRLFAGQDFFPSADRTVSGQTVTDLAEDPSNKEEEIKASDKQEPLDSSTAEKGVSSPDAEVPALVLDNFDDPLATPLAERPSCPDLIPVDADAPTERDYDSESTISALPRGILETRPLTAFRQADSSTSGLESDAVVFASRLPRRTRPAPTVADLVRRFQDSTQLERTIESLGYRLPPSVGMLDKDARESDSDQDRQTRPRLKRGKTEGYHSRNRVTKSSGMSDGGGSYALNASRIPTLSATRRPTLNRYLSVGHEIKEEEPGIVEEGPDSSLAVPLRRSHSPRLRRNNTELSLERDRTKRQRAEIGKVGKGKAPVRHAVKQDTLGDISRPGTPGLRAPSRRGGGHGGNRVSTIARHFDRLSKEAERDHVRRMNQARGRRARPVGVTRAKIHVFSNARDAFRDDETDSASSEADDEEDNEAENDFSDKEINKPTKLALKPAVAGSLPALETETSPLDKTEAHPPIATPNADRLVPAASTPLFEPSSVTPSEAPTDVSFKDRLQITLPPFDTSTPLLSVPPTPLLTGQIDTHHAASHASESEAQGSVGQERHSILKTLSNLWAYRSGDVTLLEYPLLVLMGLVPLRRRLEKLTLCNIRQVRVGTRLYRLYNYCSRRRAHVDHRVYSGFQDISRQVAQRRTSQKGY
jgi:1-phosphatidylinositol-3-phosphate 5-kinase